MARRRVVITGLGPVTGFGIGIEPLWDAMVEGRSAIKRIERFNPCGFPCKVAAVQSEDQLSIRNLVPKSERKAPKERCGDTALYVEEAGAAVREDGVSVTGAVRLSA